MAEFDETSGTKTVTYNGKVAGYLKNNQFEPLENVKGDVARIFLYVYLCWGQPNLFEDIPTSLLPAFDSDDSKNDGSKRIASLETLLQWCYDDPVDTWEMSRNDIGEIVQGNRNVFIDYPEYAWLIFGLEVPEGIASPASGNATPGTYNPGDLSGIGIIGDKIEIDETKAISLAAANQEADDQLVTVVGQVTSRFGLNDSMTSAIITDEKGDTLQLYFNNLAFDYEIGDVIAVNGSMATYHGVRQITSGFASKLLTPASEAAPIAKATEVTVAQLVDNPDAYLNKNVVVKNVVLGLPDSANHTIAISQTIDGATSTMNLYYPASYPSGVAMTDTVNIYAVASKRDTEAQLRVGKSSDYAFVSAGEGYHADLTTEAGILEAAFLLESGQSLGQAVTLTGEITSIPTAYNGTYNNITVNIKVADKKVQCYRLVGGSDLKVGDRITVTGDITNYNGTVEFVEASTFVMAGGATPTAEPTVVPTTEPTVEPTAEPTAIPTDIPSEGEYKLITTLEELGDGGQIVFYGINGNYTVAMGNTVSSKKVAGVSVTVENNTITNPSADIIWTVAKQDDGSYTLYNAAAGKYLCLDTKDDTSGCSLYDTPKYAYTVDVNDGNFFFQTTMSGNLRGISIFQSDFRAYVKNAAKTLNLYKLVEKPAVVNGVPDGIYVIYNASNGKIMSEKAKSTYYREGVDFTPAAEGEKNYAAKTELWTIKNNDDGTITITSNSGKNLSVSDGYNNATLGENNDTWILEKQDDGTFYVKNANRGLYLEWYQGQNEFSTYTISENSKDLFKMSFIPAEELVVTPTVIPFEALITEGEYKHISSVEELEEGGLVVFYGISSQDDLKYAMGNKLSLSRPLGVEVEVNDGVITNPAANIVWIVTKTEEGQYTLRNAESGKFLNLTIDSTKPFTLEDTAVPYILLGAETGNFQFKATKNERILSIYQSDFRAYKSGAKEMGTLNLYKRVMSEEEIIEAAEALAPGESLDKEYTLTGVITEIVNAYSSQYDNISVFIDVKGTKIEAFRLKNGSELKIGDKIAVTGTLTNYKGTIEFAEGCSYEMIEAYIIPAVKGEFKVITSVDEISLGGQAVFYGISIQGGSAYALSYTVCGNRPLGAEVEINDGIITDPLENVVWTVARTDNGEYTIYSASMGKYLNLSNNSTSPFTLEDTAVPYTLLGAENGNFQFKAIVNDRILSIYQNDFRAYKSGAKEMGILNLYRLVDCETYGHKYVFDGEKIACTECHDELDLSTFTGFIPDTTGEEVYLVNGELQTGLIEIDGVERVFDEDGHAFTGEYEIPCEIGRLVYTVENSFVTDRNGIYFDAEAGCFKALVNGEQAYGWTQIDGYWYYFNPQTGAVTTANTRIDWITYKFGKDGRHVEGTWVNVGLFYGMKYYFAGKAVTGIYEIGGAKYYFDNNGYLFTGSMAIVDGVVYKFNWYCEVEGEGVALAEYTGFFTGDYKTVYYENGEIVNGWKQIEGKWYYFRADGSMATISERIDGIKYKFNLDGTHTVGTVVTSRQGIRYYFAGEMVKGWLNLCGYRYYFDENGYMVTGWQDIDDATYYFMSDGTMATGWIRMGSKYYQFDSDGKYVKSVKKAPSIWGWLF